MEVRTCKTCGETKESSSFYRKGSVCKQCTLNLTNARDYASHYETNTPIRYKTIKIIPEYLQCTCCSEVKKVDQFKFGNYGIPRSICKGCTNIKSTAYYHSKKLTNKKPKVVYHQVNGELCKHCAKCGELLPVSRFYRKGSNTYHTYCITCDLIRRNINYTQNIAREQNYHSSYRKNNRDKVAHKETRRKARKLAAIGDYSTKDILLLLGDQQNKCVYCGKQITDKYTVDHIFPLDTKNTSLLKAHSSIINLQLLCKSCNSKKSNRNPILYEASLGFLNTSRLAYLTQLEAQLKVLESDDAG